MWSIRSTRSVAVAAVVAAAAMLAPTAIAQASPSKKDVARIVALKKVSTHRVDLSVDSPSMGEKVKVTVLTPGGDAPRPALYMLDGSEAGENVSDWITKGGAGRYFAGRNVNVVLPAGGAASFYTNWKHEDKVVGKPQWETFLTKELPPLIDAKFSGSGRNGILGLSMGGQSAFALTTRHPDLYQGVASLSGCPPITGPANEAYVRATLGQTGADAVNMWGRPGGATWRAHDPAYRIDTLRGKAIFLSSGSGAIGPLDLKADIDPKDGPEDAQIAAGSALEVGANRCSLEFAAQLRVKDIPFQSNFRLIGTHRWDYWKQDLPRAWQALAPAL
ncbi:esterase family protein [Gordonia sp. HY002]|uniref:alpha/beta hydrolase n=1 Tax=Gordonia zhenghanii TaxID=2911516 RepID=UPI001EEFDD03|nr:alpha/beta hydrolase family protein [Gordonia zhenghanii]MCF8569269.1 esterase family protein [Gordonia zhenghanii]MCF8605381.1 esterase family protein [Gordonia zhenghanii]